MSDNRSGWKTPLNWPFDSIWMETWCTKKKMKQREEAAAAGSVCVCVHSSLSVNLSVDSEGQACGCDMCVTVGEESD